MAEVILPCPFQKLELPAVTLGESPCHMVVLARRLAIKAGFTRLWFSNFLANALVNRVKRRMSIKGTRTVTINRQFLAMAAFLVLVAATASGQVSSPTPTEAAPLMGTWVFTMTEPEAFKGSEQTIRVWDKNGVVAASVQIGKFPPVNVTGILKDAEMLVLTVSHEAQPGLRENGAPIWAVISLLRNGETMKTAQMLERSQTIKRGTGKKQAD